ncbi:MAG: lipoate--protein ligase family protein [Methanomassiliicoccaceae archaeon]|nr:lipoate--protein ligase family protein [Methanomassiliicoccaceae archaeon]
MRFIDLGTVTPEYSVCADRVILGSHSQGNDTLLIYSRDRPCISVGRFQKIGETVNLEYTEKNDIPVVRRVSGGSSIYSDGNQMTYSLIISKDRLPATREGSFAAVCGAVVAALRALGITAEHKPVNDILVSGRKISGGAQARSGSAILQHGSIILDIDENVVASSLVNNKKRSYDGLTSIKECLGYIPSRKVIADALISGFSETFERPDEGELSEKEISDIERSVLLLV